MSLLKNLEQCHWQINLMKKLTHTRNPVDGTNPHGYPNVV